MVVVVHVIDDDESFRTAIGRLLRASGYEVRLYGSASEFSENLPDDSAPSCILLDLKIPGMSGPELQNRLAARGSTIPIIFLTGHGSIPTTVQAIKAGAEDFLTKPVSRATLMDAIEQAVARHEAVREKRSRLDSMRSAVATLTPREFEVFDLVVQGKMNKQIAGRLGTTERTIKAHRQKVMEKTKAQTFAELVSIAERLGIIADQGGPARHPSRRDGIE